MVTFVFLGCVGSWLLDVCSCRLLEYLQAMRNYFLLEAGDTMYDFYTAIFDKVQEKESWQQPSFLNVQLQEAVGQRYPEDSSRYCRFSAEWSRIKDVR